MSDTQFIAATSNNFEVGRLGNKIKYIVIHSIVGTVASAVATFQNQEKRLSAHYIIAQDGRIIQMVKEEDTAYHAGNITYNRQSIGIEHEDMGKPYDPRPDLLYETSAGKVAELAEKYNIPLTREFILRHNEVPDPNDPSKKVATACPAALDIDRIVARAKEIVAGVEEAPLYSGPVTSYTRNVEVKTASGLDLNVRNTPSTTGNVIRTLPINTVVSIEGFVTGDEVDGNKIWYKLKGENSFIWAGGTSVPTPAVKPVEETEPAPAETTPKEDMTKDELRLQVESLSNQNTILLDENRSLTKTNMDLQKASDEKDVKIAAYERDTKNYDLMKTSNEILTDQVKVSQEKIKQLNTKLYTAYVDAFQGWQLIAVPKGAMAVARIPFIALQLLTLVFTVATHDIVIGWKKDAHLYTPEQYQELYGPAS